MRSDHVCFSRAVCLCACEQADRRIRVEGRAQYEERMARERHEAYLERCRLFEERHKAKQRDYEIARGHNWADRQQSRHEERFRSRYERFARGASEAAAEKEKEKDQPTPTGAATPKRAGGSSSGASSPQQSPTAGSPADGDAAAAGSSSGGGGAAEAVDGGADGVEPGDAAAAPVVEGFASFWERRRAEVMRSLHAAPETWLPFGLDAHQSDAIRVRQAALFENALFAR